MHGHRPEQPGPGRRLPAAGHDPPNGRVQLPRRDRLGGHVPEAQHEVMLRRGEFGIATMRRIKGDVESLTRQRLRSSG